MPTRPLAACLAALDSDPSRAGFEFEQVAAWWLTADPVWASRTKRVWRWAEWPGRTSGQDLGIDLVAELVDGGLLAVQVKHRAEVPTREIDSFLAAAAGGPFSETMLLATTDAIAVNGRKKLKAAGVHIVGRGDLDASPVSWPDGLDLGGAGREPARGVRPHQAAAVADTVAALEAGDRCRVVMACGTGKTLVAQRAGETIAGTGLVVVAVPSLSLLKQTLESWARDSLTDGGLADWLAVCSDRTVADAPDPSEMPTVTTDPAAVTAWLARRKPRDRQRVVFVTHASLPILAQALDAARRTADLLIVDEAHRVAGRGQLAGLSTGPFPTRRRVFLTATPRIYTAQAKSKADGDGVEIVSMDDEDRFGPEAHHLTFAKAVAAGLLCDFEIVVSIITDADTHRLVDRRVLAELDGVQDDTATLASHLAVARAAHDWNATRTISFHTRVNQAYWFAQDHPQLAHLINPAEAVAAEATSGAVPAGARQAALDRLRHLTDADRRLLANARVLSEGVDVPAVDAVAFIDPKRSVIDIAQAVGRAMRTDPDSGKTRGLVIVPVHLPGGADPDTAADASVWKPVWDTLRALRSIDERLAEELDRCRHQLGRRTGPTEAPARLHFHSVESLGGRFVEAVTTQAVRAVTVSWEEWFGLLEAYVEERGTSRVPSTYATEAGVRLGSWVSTQRQVRHRLSAEQKARLEVLPGWEWDPHAAQWENGFAHLVAYLSDHGEARPPGPHVTADGFDLGRWVIGQRSARTKGTLAPDRRARLESLPGWVWGVRESAWETGFTHLATYASEHGDARPPVDFAAGDGYRVGQWAVSQRQRRDRLPADKRARLEQLPGWTWDTREAAWEEGLAHLDRYVATEGHARVPYEWLTPDGFKLGQWVGIQRMAQRAGDLTDDRRKRLEALPGWSWDARTDQWETAFALLEGFVAREGHARVPQTHQENGFKLGLWASGQRNRAAKRGQLTDDRRKRLEALPGWSWDARTDQWETAFALLEGFVAREGHARPSAGHVEDGYKLGSWVKRQRRVQAKGALEPERAERLQALPGWAWDTPTEQWEQAFRLVEAYAAEHGHSRVPDGHVEAGLTIGAWVGRQRQQHRAGRLDTDRTRRLAALPGWSWDANTDQWEAGFAAIAQFANREGHTRVPNDHVENGRKIQSFVRSQRQQYRAGHLDKDRTRRLEALPGWSWDPYVDQWEEAFTALRRFAEREGHCWVPDAHIEDGVRLGTWVRRQRGLRRRRELPADAETRLAGVTGWGWATADEAAWESGFAAIQSFATREGHCRVPQKWTENGFGLGRWVSKRRGAYRDGTLSADEIRQLEALPGWAWDANAAAWEDGFARLEAYAAEHGHTNILSTTRAPDGYRLGQWVTVQRQAHRRGSLSREREERLSAIDGWEWTAQRGGPSRAATANWEAGFAHLLEYVNQHGQATVPRSYVAADGHKLGSWVSDQRTARRRGNLTAEREARLEALPGWVWRVVRGGS